MLVAALEESEWDGRLKAQWSTNWADVAGDPEKALKGRGELQQFVDEHEPTHDRFRHVVTVAPTQEGVNGFSRAGQGQLRHLALTDVLQT